MPLAVIERDSFADPASGLGLWVREAHELLERIQSGVLDEQVEQFIGAAAHCLPCDKPLGVKDTKSVVDRTVFGKMRLRSPRFYSCCADCGFVSGDGDTVSPLAAALRERVHPQWAWLQCRYASTMSYRLAQILLSDSFPADKHLPSSSIKAKVRAVGERLGYETALATAVQGKKQLAPEEQPETEQQAFIRSLNVPTSATIKVLSDGGDDISLACKLPCRTERVLDWFHIGMHFERLFKAIPGLKRADELTKAQLQRKVIAAKRQLWHGRQSHCLTALEALRRDTGWVGAGNPLGRVIRYLKACVEFNKPCEPVSTNAASGIWS